MAKTNPVLKRFNYIFFLFGSLWKILAGKKEGEDIAFGRVIHGAKTGGKLLPCYHSYRCDYHRLDGRGWLYLGHLHGSEKRWKFRKILLKGWCSHVYYRVLLELLIYKAGGQAILHCQNWLVKRKLRHLKALKIYRKYVITLPDIPESLAGARWCISSAERYGENKGMEIFPGVWKEDSQAFFLDHGLTFSSTPGHEKLFDVKAEMGCFASHYLLWKKCVELGEPILILEDDVEFRAPVPPLRFKEIIHLGRPCLQQGVKALDAMANKHQEVYNPFSILLGAFAYAITPLAARKLVDAAHKMVATPADTFMRAGMFDILFYLPHPITTKLKHSSIRRASVSKNGLAAH